MCTRSALAVAIALLVAAAGTARAGPWQRPAPAQPQAQPQARAPSADEQIRAIGVSLDRIRRQLRESPPTVTISVAKLQYHIEVIGKMPPIDIMRGFNIDKTSAVPYGGMTHAEFLKVTAPPWRKW